ncbi:MAG TPA: PQQ-binding-like beta-propeller repeat protein, partial [Ktedonobacteraceae bacterium]|nr:PQQ-binding-like beta-propeller repeat protein [Ktedonobacteraceae bacterium]
VVTHATLFALDARTGQERWQFEAEHLSPPLVGEGMVFVRGQEDEKEYIYALSEEESFSHAG